MRCSGASSVFSSIDRLCGERMATSLQYRRLKPRPHFVAVSLVSRLMIADSSSTRKTKPKPIGNSTRPQRRFKGTRNGLGVGYLCFPQSYFEQYAMAAAGFPGGNAANLPVWANLGVQNLDIRPVLTCLIGLFLAIALNKVTSYYTHTSHSPVKTLARSCQTGHAMNIIQGFAVGYESPVADNANGIGEMGYDRDEMDRRQPGSYRRARQILADLDAVGNTTKAETKGIAIGSVVIAAVAGKLTVADPLVLIGFLIGGAVPFLFSSMWIRAVGRAAFFIVKEVRNQCCWPCPLLF